MTAAFGGHPRVNVGFIRPRLTGNEGVSVATGGSKKDARAAKERTRLYQARRSFHDGRLKRRRRDNLIAAIGGGALILAVVGGQIAYFTVGPGTPAPVPSPTATDPASTELPLPTDPSAPTVEPTPVETPLPAPSATTP